MKFLHIASKMATTAVYSLHKTSTRDHIVKKANDMGMIADVVAGMLYNLYYFYIFIYYYDHIVKKSNGLVW